MDYYIASCVFTKKFPELSRVIQKYVRDRYDMPVVRCCIPRYKLKEFTDAMPESYREQWASMPDSGDFQPGDAVYSLCHNCSNIIEETKPGVIVKSLWELIAGDENFPCPDYHGQEVTIQDCWRAHERADEQNAVRALLGRMNFKITELPVNRAETRFCGVSTLRAQPPRNPKIAPKHYVEQAQGLFVPHTEAEQKELMTAYCSRFETEKAVCCCHYCLEGLLLGGADAKHIASLLFEENEWRA